MKTIKLTNGKVAICDDDTYPGLMKFSWRAVKGKCCYYAKSTIKDKYRNYDLSMHRMVARTPFGQVTHHINGNSLDNRRCNLENQDKLAHTLYHANNNIRRKFKADIHDPTTGIHNMQNPVE